MSATLWPWDDKPSCWGHGSETVARVQVSKMTHTEFWLCAGHMHPAWERLFSFYRKQRLTEFKVTCTNHKCGKWWVRDCILSLHAIWIPNYAIKQKIKTKHITTMCVLNHSFMSDSLWLHRLQPARLLCPWNFSGNNTGGRLPFPTPRDLSNPWIKPTSLMSPALPCRFFATAPPGKPSDPEIPLLDIYPEKTNIQKGAHTPVFTAALFTIARTWKYLNVQW